LLVLGATGTVGRHVVDFLAKHPTVGQVLAATRNPSSFIVPSEKVVAVFVDYSKPQTLEEAFKNVEDFYLAQAQSPSLVEEAKQILDVAAKSGAKHMVHISTHALATIIGKEHSAVEEYARSVGLTVTSIRPTSFFTNLIERAPIIKAKNAISFTSGPGKINWVDNRDIGEVSARALIESSLKGRDIVVDGPQVLSNIELVELVGSVRGAPVNLVELSQEQFAGFMRESGLPEPVVQKIVDMLVSVTERNIMDVSTDNVQKITGHPARPLVQYIQENLSAFV